MKKDQQNNQGQKRAAKVRKRAAKPVKPDRDADIHLLRMQFKALEKGILTFVNDVYPKNIDETRRAFALTDLHLHAVRLLCVDVAKGKVRWAPLHPDVEQWEKDHPGVPYMNGQAVEPQSVGAEVDLQWYYEKSRVSLIAQQAAADEARKKEQDEKDKGPDDVQEPVPEEEPDGPPAGVEVFGGDYAGT